MPFEWTVYRLFTEEGEYFGITSNLPIRLQNHRNRGGQQDHPYYGFEILKTDLSYEEACQIEDLLITSMPCINLKRSGLIEVNNKLEYKRPYMRNCAQRVREGEMMMFGKTHRELYRRWFK